MPHQCVRCSSVYNDGAQEILKGCSCGSRMFFYIRKERLEAAQEMTSNFSKREKKQIESDVMDLIGQEKNAEKPVILDIEAIRISGPGKFELDLVHLFKKDDPLIYKLEEGKYMIDIPATFEKRNKIREEEP